MHQHRALVTQHDQSPRIVLPRRIFILLPVLAGLGFLVAVGFYATSFSGELADSNEIWGQFGDYLGGLLNPIFGFLSLIAILATLFVQGQELRYSTEELAKSAEALKLQSEAMVQQNFENTFFQLLRLHNDIVNAIDLRETQTLQVTSKGRDCFRPFYKRFKDHWTKQSSEHTDRSDRERINHLYLAYYPRIEAELGHYFRSLYNIVKLVDRSSVANKRLYTNLIRAQLSKFELALLFYNCLSDMGSEKFLPLIRKYDLLKMIPKNELIDTAHIDLLLSG